MFKFHFKFYFATSSRHLLLITDQVTLVSLHVEGAVVAAGELPVAEVALEGLRPCLLAVVPRQLVGTSCKNGNGYALCGFVDNKYQVTSCL